MSFERDTTRRQIITQDFTATSLAVPSANAVPIANASQQSAIGALYDAIEICVPSTAAASVFFGGNNLDTTIPNGIEIIAGSSRFMKIKNERQLYELQAPLVEMNCGGMMDIQFKVWDVSQLYLRAAAGTITVGIVLYKGNFF